jgi:hypothetical protein
MQESMDHAGCLIDDAMKCGGYHVSRRPAGRVRDLIAHFDPRALQWYGSESPSLGLLQPPPSIQAITEPESLRRQLDEIWTAANWLPMALDKWAAWFVELQEKGDADPRVALNCDEMARRAIHVLLTYLRNLEKFDQGNETSPMAMLPPIPAWWMPAAESEMDDQNTKQNRQRRTRWQEDREFLDRYYAPPEQLHEKACKLRSASTQLIGMLKSFPMAVFANKGPSGTTGVKGNKLAPRRRRMTLAAANTRASELAKEDSAFLSMSLRAWANAIGCSEGQVVNLDLWIAQHKQADNESKKRKSPKTVTLTESLLAVTPERDESLQRLIREHKADREPSPLEPDPPDKRRRVRSRKEL